MKETRMSRLHGTEEPKYRAKMYKSGKHWVVKGMLFSGLLLGGSMFVNAETVKADEWVANSVETIQAKLKENQTSYTFEEGDTFYNISLAVNVKWQTLMEINGFEEGSQYSVPVGTTITFDGSKITVTDKDGKVVNEVKLTNEDKVDQSKTFANQKSDTPSKEVTNQKNTATKPNVNPNTNTTNGKKPDSKVDDKDVENAKKEKEKAEEQKRKEEEAKKEAERQKVEAEKKLTAELNKTNSDKLKDLEAKRAQTEQQLEEAQKTVADKTAAIAPAQEKVNQAQVAVNQAQDAVDAANGRVSSAQSKVDGAQAELNAVDAEIQALKTQATELEDATSQAKLAELNTRREQAQANLGTYQAELDTAKAEFMSLSAQATAVNASLAASQAELNQVLQDLEAAQANVSQAQKDLSSLPTNVEAANSEEAKKIQAELAALDAKIKKIDAEIAKLEDKIEVLDAQIKGVEIDAENSQEYAEKVKEKADKVDVDSNVPEKTKEEANDIKNELPKVEDKRPEVRRVEKNIDEAGNELNSLDGFVFVSKGEAVLVISEENGKTIHTYTTTSVYHKVINTDKEVTINQDTEGNVIEGSLNNYELVSTSESVKTVETLANGDTVTTYTTTNTYKLKEAVKPIERHETVNKDEAGNVITGSLAGYTLVTPGTPNLVVSEENGKVVHTYTTTNIYHQNVNTDKHVTINKDSDGNVIEGSLNSYELVHTNEPVKTVKTLPNGDTVTTYTTVKTYKLKEAVKPIERHETINKDEAGNVITGSLTGYTLVESGNSVIIVSEENGKVVHTYTTTNIYHKNVNTNKEVTDNKDESGNVITGSLDGYKLVTKGEAVKTIETLSNGDTVTTYTTTNVYHKLMNTDKEVTVNKDESGNVITGSLNGYKLVKQGEAVKTIETLANGDTITTYTTTNVHHKIVNTDKQVVINKDDKGNVITGSLADYELVTKGQPVKTVETLANGDTVTTYTTTNIYRKKEVTVKDPIIENIKGKDDQEIKDIKNQVKVDDTGVSIEQGEQLTDAELTQKVADNFILKVQAEQNQYGENEINMTNDGKAGGVSGARAVEVMYLFDHETPGEMLLDGTYAPIYNVGDEQMTFNSENIAQHRVSKKQVDGDSDKLAELIADQMFEQYIEMEREAARNDGPGQSEHYENIIMSDYSDMSIGIFVVDMGSHYEITSVVYVGNATVYRG
ncbi:LysM peptidoglycan-binding domain-containing protein [Vagococcus hydrophili]|uniref:LysM peptidoglycan-binding domain-containing protein n=1 Tax=Vagococcus hydrophili TaxID=2714947 RepID=A0A6G8ASU7_9ENTE|nr:LysM peptidoglycan-binding domain-containing protein [Vagococcus hydrophili]QIL48067.1 LysM peptidoglycan-binding domain-containing protein [Vagococcus hydrophili]